MYPGDFNGFVAIKGAIGFDGDVANLTNQYADYTYWADFIFQAMFAATAATIVSGAVAERVKLSGFMFYATILVTFAYPIGGSWKWGGGWLDSPGQSRRLRRTGSEVLDYTLILRSLCGLEICLGAIYLKGLSAAHL